MVFLDIIFDKNWINNDIEKILAEFQSSWLPLTTPNVLCAEFISRSTVYVLLPTNKIIDRAFFLCVLLFRTTSPGSWRIYSSFFFRTSFSRPTYYSLAVYSLGAEGLSVIFFSVLIFCLDVKTFIQFFGVHTDPAKMKEAQTLSCRISTIHY